MNILHRSPLRWWLAVGWAGAALALARADLKPGAPFPADWTSGLTGAARPDLAGKIILVDFCASWCAPCKASFPVYDRLQADYAGRGLAIVAVSVDEDPAAYAAFVRRLHPTFPVLLDSAQRLVGAVQVPTMPTSYLLDRTGRVRYVHRGFHGASTERELRQHVEALLAEPAARS
jgi:thiol-disulfide isomerase/thioredoxin